TPPAPSATSRSPPQTAPSSGKARPTCRRPRDATGPRALRPADATFLWDLHGHCGSIILTDRASLAPPYPGGAPPEHGIDPVTPVGQRVVNTPSFSLLDRLKAAPPDAADWGRLQEMYLPLIEHWLRRVPGLGDEAADLAQEVLVVVFREVPRFE